MTTGTWPAPHDALDDFYSAQLAIPLDLWRAFRVEADGSQRPPGPRRLQWAATLVLGVAALEAGLEELLVSAHGHRLGRTGQQSLARDTRKHLVEAPLQTPSAPKIDRLLLSSFGVELGALPVSAHFVARKKTSPNTGSGRGSKVAGPTTWAELKEYLSALLFIRHAAAHGDAVKIAELPPSANGLLWVERQDGSWSVQQPHALTGLRTVVATFNAVAESLDAKVQLFAANHDALKAAGDLVAYPGE